MPGSYSVINQASGTFTGLPGRRLGDPGRPRALPGRRQARRALVRQHARLPHAGRGRHCGGRDRAGRAPAQRGPGRAGLRQSCELDPASDEFSWRTKAAIEKLQAHLGVSQTGEMALGHVVFLPSAARITTVPAALGGQAGQGMAAITRDLDCARVVTMALDAAQQSQVVRRR